MIATSTMQILGVPITGALVFAGMRLVQALSASSRGGR